MARKVKAVDPDEVPEITDEMFARMRPLREAAPDLAAAIRALRGRPKVEHPKKVVSIRLGHAAYKRWAKLETGQRSKLIAGLEKKIIAVPPGGGKTKHPGPA